VTQDSGFGRSGAQRTGAGVPPRGPVPDMSGRGGSNALDVASIGGLPAVGRAWAAELHPLRLAAWAELVLLETDDPGTMPYAILYGDVVADLERRRDRIQRIEHLAATIALIDDELQALAELEDMTGPVVASNWLGGAFAALGRESEVGWSRAFWATDPT
jgi:hypothetical protein